MKDTEPFSFAGNDTGVLVLHGFTGTTQSVRYLGQELNSRFGFTVEGPDEVPVACFDQVTVLVSITRDLLPRIACPALIVQAREDHVVPAANAIEILRTIRSEDIRYCG